MHVDKTSTPLNVCHGCGPQTATTLTGEKCTVVSITVGAACHVVAFLIAEMRCVHT